MSPGADRNLLFGILALQMDFITRDQLVAGMNAWLVRKEEALGTILLDQKALAPERHALLAALVQEHIRQHDNDPQKSLAALSSLGATRDDLQQLPDPDLQASLVHLPPLSPLGPGARGEGRSPASDPSATRSFTVGESSSAGLRFRIVRPHAEGGLGKVSVALDEELHREVALKEIKERHADDSGSRARFVLEAEITGGLEHPGIVPVYGLGTYADGRPFYAMRFIRGDSLKEAIERFHPDDGRASSRKADVTAGGHVGLTPRRSPGFASLEFRKLLGRFIDVCNAIAYAHSRGVLHRDLKPGNIMLGKFGETLVVDWGLAKAVGTRPWAGGSQQSTASSLANAAPSSASSTLPDEPPLQPSSSDHGATVAGSAVGTPAFMSPEQAAGRLDLLGPASNVYSLGATLYVLLTGKVSFHDKEIGELLRKVQRGEFSSPRQVNADVPAPLDAVCKKAMALRPEDRYATPLDLAADIEHWLADEPVSAWPEPWTVKARRWGAKHRMLIASAAMALLVAIICSIGANVLLSDANQTIRQREHEARATGAELAKANDSLTTAMDETKSANLKLAQEQQETTLARDKALRNLYLAQMAQAHLAWKDGQVGRVLDLLDAQKPESNGGYDFRGFEWHYLRRLCHSSHTILAREPRRLDAVACSADGRIIASASSPRRPDDPHRPELKLWDAATGKELRSLEGYTAFHSSRSLALSPDGSRVAAFGGQDEGSHTIRVWDTTTGKTLYSVRVEGEHTFHGNVLAFSPDGRHLGTALEKSIRLWDAETGKEIDVPFEPHATLLECINFSADGTRVVGGAMLRPGPSPPATVIVWDVKTGKQVAALTHPGDVEAIALSPDGKSLASTGQDSNVRTWDLADKKEKWTLHEHGNLLAGVVFTRDGQNLLSASLDGTIKVCDVKTGSIMRTLRGHPFGVTGMALPKDGRRLVSSGMDGTIRVWQLDRDQEALTLSEPLGPVTSLAFHPQGRRLAVGSLGVSFWDLPTAKVARSFTDSVVDFHTMSLAFSADGSRLAAGSMVIKLWDVESGKKLGSDLAVFRKDKAPEGMVQGLAFSPDGKNIASCGAGLRVWDIASGQLVSPKASSPLVILGAAYSIDGSQLAGGEGRVVTLWNAASGEVVRTFPEFPDTVMKVSFSRDGRKLLAASNSTVRVWELPSGTELIRFPIISTHIPVGDGIFFPGRLAFSADGQRLATAPPGAPAVVVWDTMSGQQILSLLAPGSQVVCIAFSPDNRRLAAGGLDENKGILRIWDARPENEQD